MRAWMDELDAEHDVHIHAVDKSNLDTIAQWNHESAISGEGKGKDGWHVARCDGFTIMKWCNERGITWARFFQDERIVNEFLNDPDNAMWRVCKGRV